MSQIVMIKAKFLVLFVCLQAFTFVYDFFFFFCKNYIHDFVFIEINNLVIYSKYYFHFCPFFSFSHL